MPDAFLDSSALIEFVFRHREARVKVENTLPPDGRRLTSRYVLFEIARGYLLSLLVLRNKSCAVQSLTELHEYLHSGQQIRMHYRRETMLGAYDDHIAHLATLGISLTQDQQLAHFRGWLGQHLRRGWRQLSRVAEVTNRIGCREDIPSPSLKANGLYEQRLPTHECGDVNACGLDKWLSAIRTELQTIAKGLAALKGKDQETERRVLALQRLIAKSAGSDFEGRDCWSCGDAFICEESPSSAIVISKNRKHFEPLCALVGRTLFAYS